MLEQQRTCAAIHDLSGAGKCSLTVALPVLSVCGVETSVLPTAVLSTHTGGFTGFTYRDLTEDLLPVARHWKKAGFRFHALYSGFLGSEAQIDLVAEIFQMFREPGTFVVVDPVMGDNGKLYQTYTEEMAQSMVRLCRRADLVVPNITEACRLLEIPYREGPYTRAFIGEVLAGLCELGPQKAVLTGVYLEEKRLGAACLDRKAGKPEFFLRDRMPGFYHGTGDLFASVLVGGLFNGMSLSEACDTAVEFTHRSIVSTKEKSKDFRFGPKFEEHLPWLGEKMEECRKNLAKSDDLRYNN